MSEIWVMNQIISQDNFPSTATFIMRPFDTDTINYTRFANWSLSDPYLSLYVASPGGTTQNPRVLYRFLDDGSPDNTWYSESYRTWEFLEPVTGELLSWLQVNGVKQSAGGIGLKNLSSYNQDLSIPRKKDLDALETKVDSKQDAITGGASTITTLNLTANRVLVSNSSGKVTVSPVTSTELGYLDGVTSNVQTQLSNKQPTVTVNGIVQGDGAGNLSAVETVNADLLDLNPAAVGLGNVDNVRQYSVSNPPPYPVTSVNGKTGAVTISALPTVTTADNGKFLRVVNGVWAADTVPSAGGVAF